MKGPSDTEEVRNILHQFQNGYKERNIEKLDEFVALFVQDEEIDLIGIGAYERGGVEWFEGVDKIREIILPDWEYWGDVVIDVGGAKISVKGDAAWYRFPTARLYPLGKCFQCKNY